MRIIDRRGILAGAGAVAGLVAFGQSLRAESANPMPPELRKAIERQPFAPVLGNPKGDVTLSEFFDYNCPACRSTFPALRRLIASDPGLRVVLREWPIFGEGSEFAARASLAALKQGRYMQLHERLMGMRGQANQASVLAAARKAGLDLARLEQDMQGKDVAGHIERSIALADHMSLAGTPTFIAGDGGAFGGQSLSDLKALVAQAQADLG